MVCFCVCLYAFWLAISIEMMVAVILHLSVTSKRTYQRSLAQEMQMDGSAILQGNISGQEHSKVCPQSSAALQFPS